MTAKRTGCLLRTLTALVVILALAVIAWPLVAPRVVEYAARRAASQAGITDLQLTVESVGLRRTLIRNLSLAGGRWQAGWVVVTYDLADLRRGRVHNVELTDADVRLHVTQTGLDLGLPIRAAEPREPSRPAPLPLDEVVIRSATVQLNDGAHAWTLPLSGRLLARENQSLSATAALTTALGEIRTDIAFDPASQEGSAKVNWVGAGPVVGELAKLQVDATVRGQQVVMNAQFVHGQWHATAQASGDLSDETRWKLTGDWDAVGLAGWELAKGRWQWAGRGQPLVVSSGVDGGGIQSTWRFDAPTFGNEGWTLHGDWSAQAGPGWRLEEGHWLLDAGGRRAELAARLHVEQAERLTGQAAWKLSADWNRQVVEAVIEPGAGATIALPAMTDSKNPWRLTPVSVSITEPVSAAWRWSSKSDRLQLGGVVNVTCAGIGYPAGDLALRDIAASLPLSYGEADARAGQLRIGGVSWRGKPLPALQQTLAMQKATLTTEGTWPLSSSLTVEVKGEADLTKTGFPVVAHVVAPPFNPSREPLLPLLLPEISGMVFDGQLEATGRFTLASGDLSSRVQLAVRDMQVTARQWQVEATGVSGDLTLINVMPPRSLGNQPLTIPHLKVGKIGLDNGKVAWRLESPRSLFIERMTWGLGDQGKAWVHSFRLDPLAPTIDVEMFVEDLPLTVWLGLLTDQQLEGRGRLYGRVPVRIQPGDEAKLITLERGFLASRPAIAAGPGVVGGPGDNWVKVQDRQWVASMVKQAGLGAQGQTAEMATRVQQNLVEALSDFQFTNLRFDFEPGPEGLICRVATAGRGREGARQEIGSLNINISGLDVILNEGLRVQSSARESLGDALDQLLGPPPAGGTQ